MKWADMTARERDALVAEKIMGYTITEKNAYNADTAEFPVLMFDESLHCLCLYEKFDGVGWTFTPFSPSTDMSAAWEVVEKVTAELDTAERSYCEPHIRKHNSRWECYWLSIATASPPTIIARSENVCETICLAALRAVGVDVE